MRVRLVRDGTAARLQAIDDGRGLDNDAVDAAVAPATSGSTHKLRIQAAGGTFSPAAAQHVGTVASVDVPVPVSDPVPTVDPSQLRADLLRGELHHLEGGAGGAG